MPSLCRATLGDLERPPTPGTGGQDCHAPVLCCIPTRQGRAGSLQGHGEVSWSREGVRQAGDSQAQSGVWGSATRAPRPPGSAPPPPLPSSRRGSNQAGPPPRRPSWSRCTSEDALTPGRAARPPRARPQSVSQAGRLPEPPRGLRPSAHLGIPRPVRPWPASSAAALHPPRLCSQPPPPPPSPMGPASPSCFSGGSTRPTGLRAPGEQGVPRKLASTPGAWWGAGGTPRTAARTVLARPLSSSGVLWGAWRLTTHGHCWEPPEEERGSGQGRPEGGGEPAASQRQRPRPQS